MADIFISYSKEDRERAEVLAAALTDQGWSVFWDRTIPPGLTWREVIGKELEEASCVLVAWSESSVESRWVLEEAEGAAERGVLIPILFETVDLPLGFGAFQAADLSDWGGGVNISPFPELVEGLERLLGPSPVRAEEGQERAEVEKARKGEAGAPGKAEQRRMADEDAARKSVEDGVQETSVPRSVGGTAVGKLRNAWGKSSPAAKLALLAVVVVVSVLTYNLAVPSRPSVDRALGATRDSPPNWEDDDVLNRRILIQGGAFQMGSADDPAAWESEHPQHRVTISGFYLQEHEVTNAEYRRFNPHHEPNAPNDHPVVNVSWYDATAYAEWLDGSLPTEAQWEFAARGTDGRKYPWGDGDPTCERAKYLDCGNKTTVAVKSYEAGATPLGIYDLAGNVTEWIADWYGPYAINQQEVDPTGPPSISEPPTRVLRGGSFGLGPRLLRGAARYRYLPADSVNDLGFRVAWLESGGLE